MEIVFYFPPKMTDTIMGHHIISFDTLMAYGTIYANTS